MYTTTDTKPGRLAYIAFLIGAALEHDPVSNEPVPNSIKVFQSKVKFHDIRVYCDLVSKEKVQLIQQLNTRKREFESDLHKDCFLNAVCHYRNVYRFFMTEFPDLRGNIMNGADYIMLLHDTPLEIYNAICKAAIPYKESEMVAAVERGEKVPFSGSFFAMLTDIDITWKEFFVALGYFKPEYLTNPLARR